MILDIRFIRLNKKHISRIIYAIHSTVLRTHNESTRYSMGIAQLITSQSFISLNTKLFER